MTAPISLEPVTADMYGPLADFNADFENETRPAPYWADRFRVWWEDNPAWRDGDMRGWTLMRQGRIVGFVGVFPANFQLNGDETRAWISTTWRVQTAHRGQSLQLMRAVVSAAGQDLLFSTTAKQQIAPVMEALGYRRMPAAGGPRSLLVVNAARFSEVLLLARSGTMMARLIPSFVRRVQLGVIS